MTESENLALTPRESGTQTSASQHFAFFRLREDESERFYPSSAALHFASKDTDTLSLGKLPENFLLTTDSVRVTYKGATVFLGSVDRRTARTNPGTEKTQDVVCVGPWSKMSRLVYLQKWYAYTSSGLSYVDSSRLILNQTKAGLAQTLSSELGEILSYAETKCGFELGTINVPSQYLPFDECRDITIADAVRRELRLFPRVICAFDYSEDTPVLNITRPTSTTDASYIADIPKTSRVKEFVEHPIVGVDLEIETTGEIDGATYRKIDHQRYAPTTVDYSGLDILHAALQLRGASSNVVRQSFKSVTETIPTNLNDKSWWIAKHPRLKNVASSTLTITEAARSDSSEASDYPRIAAATVGEIEEAGLKAHEAIFSCKAKIVTADHEEEDILLTMNFVTTNAEGTAENPRTYSWVSESSASSGESAPSGLAQAIYNDRAGELKSESMVVRLDTLSAWPRLGDRCDSLTLQTIDIDCADLTASLSFGHGEFLAIEDIASLLSNFRNKRRSTSSTSRASGKKSDDGDAEVGLGGIPPSKSTEFSPGKVRKTTIGGGSDGKTIELDPSGLDSDQPTMGVKDLKLEDTSVAKVMATGDITISQKRLEAGANITITESADGKTITIAATGGGGSSEPTGYTGDIVKIDEATYDKSTHILSVKVSQLSYKNGLLKAVSALSDAIVTTAVEETV